MAEYHNVGCTIASQGINNYHGPVYYNLPQSKQGLLFDEENRILKWLEITETNYQTLQNDYFIIRQPTTGEWLLESDEYQGWLTNNSTILFCPGIPGAGKTILTSIVIDHLTSQHLDNPKIGIAYIYFNYKRTKDQQVNQILLSLLSQLVQRQTPAPLPTCVKTLYERHRGKTRPSRGEIVNALHSIIPTFSKTFIIIDALDECQSDNDCRSIFLEELFEMHQLFDINIFATSRFIPEIETSFANMNSARLEIRAFDEDMQSYLDSKIERSGKAVLKNHKEIIKARIIEQAHGMFLLAHLHFESIRGKPTFKVITRVLRNLGKATGTAAYDHAYEEAMTRITGIEDEDSRELAYRILKWITCAARPLTTTELQHALAVELDQNEPDNNELDKDNIPDVQDIVSLCAGLVTVDQGSDVIRLVHHTTQEYFERNQSRWFPHAHRDIVATCITYMSYDVFEGTCSSNEELSRRLDLYSLYNYAVENWGYHMDIYFTDSEVSPQISKLALDFLRNDALRSAWTQVMFATRAQRLFDMTIQESWSSKDFPNKMLGLHVAAHLGLPLAIVEPLAVGADMDARDGYGWTPLLRAVTNGKLDVVKVLMEKGADIEAKDDDYGQTPLIWAVEYGHFEVVSLLLDKGADIEAKDKKFNQTAVAFATNSGNAKLLSLLVEKGANIELKDCVIGSTPLSWAAGRGDREMVELLVDKGANIEAKRTSDETPLIEAAQGGDIEMVILLIQKGSDLEAKDAYGQTSLSWAATVGHTKVVDLLILKGADIETKDKDEQTPLILASEEGHEELVDLLVEKGANTEAKDRVFGQTPVSWAAKNGHTEVVKSLLQGGADIETRDELDQTPLMLAAAEGYLEVVKLLIEKGANTEATDLDHKRTPLLWAVEGGHEDIVEWLKKN